MASDDDANEELSERLSFKSLSCIPDTPRARKPEERCLEILAEWQNLVLGYDVLPELTTALIGERRQLGGEIAVDNVSIREQEDLLLTRFTDVASLSRRQPAAVTDLSGRFTLRQVPPRSVRIVVEIAGFAADTVTIPLTLTSLVIRLLED